MPTTAVQTKIAQVQAFLTQADLNATWAPMADLVDEVLAHCTVEDTDRVMDMWTGIEYGHHDDLILVEELLDVIAAVLPAPELDPVFAKVAEKFALRQQITDLTRELESLHNARISVVNTQTLDERYDRTLAHQDGLVRQFNELVASEDSEAWLVAEGRFQLAAWEIHRIKTLWYEPASDLSPFDAGVMHLALSN